MYIRKPSQNCISIPIYNIDFVFTNARPDRVKIVERNYISEHKIKIFFLTYLSTNILRVVPHFFFRVGWFSRALAFRSLYYPLGKMGDYS